MHALGGKCNVHYTATTTTATTTTTIVHFHDDLMMKEGRSSCWVITVFSPIKDFFYCREHCGLEFDIIL